MKSFALSHQLLQIATLQICVQRWEWEKDRQECFGAHDLNFSFGSLLYPLGCEVFGDHPLSNFSRPCLFHLIFFFYLLITLKESGDGGRRIMVWSGMLEGKYSAAWKSMPHIVLIWFNFIPNCGEIRISCTVWYSSH